MDPSARQYEFVIGTGPSVHRNNDVRKMVRTHVMNEHIRTKKQRKSARNDQGGRVTRSSSSNTQAQASEHEASSEVPRLLGYPSALCTYAYPIAMQTRTHQLLSTYLCHVTRRAHPLEQHLKINPSKCVEWFHLAVNDKAMFHALLFAMASVLALLEGKSGSDESMYHMTKTIEIVNKRLRENVHLVEETTIGALSCLALGEAVVGNVHLWHVHMRGLKEMIRAKGDVQSFNKSMQLKVRRSDIIGAIDYLALPYLEFEREDSVPIWSCITDEELKIIKADFIDSIAGCDLHPDLVLIMMDVALFSNALRKAQDDPATVLNPYAFSEDLYWIEYRLLSFTTHLLTPSEEAHIDRACRIAGLLYMKLVLNEFPYSKNGSSILLNTLRESLARLQVTRYSIQLILWISVVGSLASQTTDDRNIFNSFVTGFISTWSMYKKSRCNIPMHWIFPLHWFVEKSLKVLSG
ncbi:hypothetical protein PVAG01_08787 [Phlyctema vagabunda]|uniref:Uncharacterized protein n=1 Tax=Phlyctema vagabunda TaxID=108571 RepID=A0ABR4PAE3_9HELO